jgi:hypothetical protein
MAGSETIRVKGVKELQRELRKYDKDMAKEMRAKLKDAGEIVRGDAASRFSEVDARSAMGFRTRVRGGSVFVEQSRGRTTGEHPEFGVLQMERALLPALSGREDEVTRSLEDMLDTLGRKGGF